MGNAMKEFHELLNSKTSFLDKLKIIKEFHHFYAQQFKTDPPILKTYILEEPESSKIAAGPTKREDARFNEASYLEVLLQKNYQTLQIPEELPYVMDQIWELSADRGNLKIRILQEKNRSEITLYRWDDRFLKYTPYSKKNSDNSCIAKKLVKHLTSQGNNLVYCRLETP